MKGQVLRVPRHQLDGAGNGFRRVAAKLGIGAGESD